MNRKFNLYILIWITLIIVFNIVAFITPRKSSFWISYTFMLLIFIGDLICGYKIMKENDIDRQFMNLPLINISYSTTIISIIITTILMISSKIPYWVSLVICTIMLGYTIISILNAAMVEELVINKDHSIKQHTHFIKNLTTRSQNLIPKSKISEIQEKIEKVHQALRYSDPVSNPSLIEIENRIELEFEMLENAVNENNQDKAAYYAQNMLTLIEQRNNQCKERK